MSRFESLLDVVSTEYPGDWWLSRLKDAKSDVDTHKQFSNQLEIYSSALEFLDDESWNVLREKALGKFKADSKDRGKYQFFNVLNEAFAYQFLIEHGMDNVRLVEEIPKSKTPDIKFRISDAELSCEVKTIGISNEEIIRSASGDLVDSSIYSELGEGFLRKLSSDINNASEQIGSVSPLDIIYMVVHFDDFSGFNYQKYEEDIRKYLEKEHSDLQIYIRVDIENRFFIHTKPQIR